MAMASHTANSRPINMDSSQDNNQDTDNISQELPIRRPVHLTVLLMFSRFLLSHHVLAVRPDILKRTTTSNLKFRFPKGRFLTYV